MKIFTLIAAFLAFAAIAFSESQPLVISKDAKQFSQQQTPANLPLKPQSQTSCLPTYSNAPPLEPEDLITDTEKQRMAELLMKGIFLLPERERNRLIELYQEQISPEDPEFEESLSLAQKSLELLSLDEQKEFEKISLHMSARSREADYPNASDRLSGKDLELFERKVILQLPDGFRPMPASMIAQKFQRGNPPRYAYSTEDGLVFISLDRFLMKPLPPGDAALDEFKDWFEMACKLTVDGFKVVERGYIIIAGVKWIKQDLILPASDSDPEIRNIVLYTSFEGYPLMAQFSCPVQHYPQVADDLSRSMNSIRIK